VTPAATERVVREILSEIALTDDCLRAPGDMTLDAIGVDSAGMIELVFALEDRFSIQIGEDEIDPGNFQSIESLTALVVRKCP
jgi:acyl carrier protein